MRVVVEPQPNKRLTPEQLAQGAGKGFLYHESSQPLYKIKLLLKNLESEPELYTNSIKEYAYRIPRLIHFLNLIEKMNRGIMPIHGAAVVHPTTHQGVIITGWSDTGKTTTMVRLARHGFGILGDDRVLLDNTGQITRIQQQAGVYPHPDNIHQLRLPPRDKLLGWLKYRFARVTTVTKILLPNLRVAYHKIGQVYDHAQIKRIYILEKGQPDTYRPDYETAVNRIITTSSTLWRVEGFPQYIFERYCFTNDLSLTYMVDRARSILASALKHVEILVIRRENFSDFAEAIAEYELEHST